MLIPLSFKVMDKLAIEPGFICFPTNLKLIEEGGGGLFEGSAYLMFGLAGGAYLSVGAYSRKYGIPQFSWGYIRSRDAFRPIARD